MGIRTMGTTPVQQRHFHYVAIDMSNSYSLKFVRWAK
jgi:hypothetical protein